MFSFRTWSLSVWPHDHLHIFISVAFSLFTWEQGTGTVSIPYSSTHTAKIDIVLNTVMHIVSGCLKMTPTFYLPVVSGIIPPDIRISTISLKLFNKANSDPAHLLYNACTRGSTIKPILTSRTPFSRQCV